MRWKVIGWVGYAVTTEIALLLDWFLAVRHGENGNLLGFIVNTVYAIGVIGYAMSLRVWSRSFWTLVLIVAALGVIGQLVSLLLVFSTTRLYSTLFGMAVFTPTIYALWRYQQSRNGIWGFEWAAAKVTVSSIFESEGQIRLACVVESSGKQKEGAVTLRRTPFGYEVHLSILDGLAETNFVNEFNDEASALRFIKANTSLMESDFRAATGSG